MYRYQFVIDKIRELFREASGSIPLHAPVFVGNEKKYLEECIDSTYVSSVGKFVDLFEEKVADYTQSKKAVVCVNGSNALYIALKLSGVAPGDEVITQPLTFISTVNAISYCGAAPVFIDVDKDTMGLSPSTLRKFISENTIRRGDECFNKLTGNRIKACVPMHTFGHPCKIDQIEEICSSNNIDLIEDAAESFGSFYKGKHTGTFGKVGMLSFNGNKIITTGGGGMLLFNDEIMAARAKHITTQAKVPHKWEFVHDETGYNFRMPNINAALGIAQLENIDLFLQSKRDLAKQYSSFFRNNNMLFFDEPVNCTSNYWLNCILFDSQEERDEFLEESNKQKVMTRPAWKLMIDLTMYRDAVNDGVENARWIEKRLVNIPSSVRI